jgi:hypothetical protein
MGADYRSPSSGSVAAASTPARLAQEFDAVLWRQLPNGSLEVAVRDGNRLERLRVHDDGSMTLVAATPLRSTSWATVLGGIGVALAFVSWLELIAWGISTGKLEHVFLVLFFVGLGLGFVAGLGLLPVTAGWSSSLGHGWHSPTDLSGWSPRSAAQLVAVERIANKHGGLAFVRDHGADTVDVQAGRERHAVDEDGFEMRYSQPAETPLQRSRRWLFGGGCLGLWLYGLPTAGAHFGIPGLLVDAAIATAATAAFFRTERPPQELGDHLGTEWLEIRTRDADV